MFAPFLLRSLVLIKRALWLCNEKTDFQHGKKWLFRFNQVLIRSEEGFVRNLMFARCGDLAWTTEISLSNSAANLILTRARGGRRGRCHADLRVLKVESHLGHRWQVDHHRRSHESRETMRNSTWLGVIVGCSLAAHCYQKLEFSRYARNSRHWL